MDPELRAIRSTSFNGAAAQYAAARPSYPPVLFDTMEEIAGRELTGARVLDVGAGTGISTVLLTDRGADVLALEPGEGMAAQFRRDHPDIPLVRADGNHLPLRDATADFVTYAQSWHWTEPPRSFPEAMRVLRPGGALAMWWNTDAQDVPWIDAQADRVRRFFGDDLVSKAGGGGRESAFEGLSGASTHGAAPSTGDATATAGAVDATPPHTTRTLRWTRRIPLATHLANIASHSAFLILGEEGTQAFLAEEREHLLEVFPDGMVEEVYDVVLIVVIRP